jgi:hypothetical protein
MGSVVRKRWGYSLCALEAKAITLGVIFSDALFY